MSEFEMEVGGGVDPWRLVWWFICSNDIKVVAHWSWTYYTQTV